MSQVDLLKVVLFCLPGESVIVSILSIYRILQILLPNTATSLKPIKPSRRYPFSPLATLIKGPCKADLDSFGRVTRDSVGLFNWEKARFENSRVEGRPRLNAPRELLLNFAYIT